MIGVVLDGRLGNQLFQYSFAINLAKRHKCNFFINQNKTDFILLKYFELPSYGRIKNSILMRLYNKKLLKFSEVNYSGTNKFVLSEEFPSQGLFTGFFQSEDYFKDSIQLLKKEFQIKKKYVEQYSQKYRGLINRNRVIVIHLRRSDYLTFGDNETGVDLSLPLEYYQNALKLFDDLENYKILVVSDDPLTAKLWFQNLPNVSFEENSEIIDFQLIMNADIAIIANSSFSWWAAYLNAKEHKIVYAPKYWLGFKVDKEIPEKIMSVNWNWINAKI